MPGTQAPSVIPFGPLEADLHAQELRKLGVRLRLPRQSFQILKMLLEHPGELVTREEMRAACEKPRLSPSRGGVWKTATIG